MPLSTFITRAGGFEPVFYARVEGVPYYFYANRQPSWSPAISGTAWRRGLLLPEVTVDAGIDLITGLPRVGGMTLEFQDDATGFFRILFAAGRWDGDANTYNTEVTGAGITRATTSTIPVLNASAFDPVTLPADFYVGNETINISAKDNVANTLTIAASGRGRYPAVGSTRFAYDHIPTTSPTQVSGFRPRICAVASTPGFATPVPAPYTWLGRTVAVYANAYDPDAGTYGAESESVVVFAGRIRSKEFTQDGTWKLGCTHITEDLQKEAFARLRAASLRGYFFTETQYLLLYSTDKNQGAPWISLVGAGINVAAGTIASWEALKDTIVAGLPTTGTYRVTMERDWVTEAAGNWNAREFHDRTIFVMTKEDGTAVADMLVVQATEQLAAVFGMSSDVPPATAYASNQPDLISSAHRNSVTVLGPISEALHFHPAGGYPAGTTIPVSHVDDFSIPDDTSAVLATGAFVLGGEHVYVCDQISTANRTLRTLLYAGLAPSYTSEPRRVLAQPQGGSPVAVQQVYRKLQYVAAHNLLARLLYSTGSLYYNHAAHDRLPRGWGLGIPADLIESTLADDINVLTSVPTRDYYFDRPTKAADIVSGEATLFGWGLTWRTGKIAAIALGQITAPPGAVAITTSVRAGASAQRAVDPMTARETAGSLVNQVKLEMDRVPGTDNYRTAVVLNDTVSQDAFGEVRAAVARNAGLRTGSNDALNQALGGLLVDKLARFNRPMPVVRFRVARPRYDLYAGQVVLLSDDRFPNPFTGAEGLASIPARVISVRFDWREMVGECTAILDPMLLYTRLANIAPSALVTARAAGAPNDTLTLSVNDFTDATLRKDVDLFDVSDRVFVVEADPGTPAAPQSWARTVLTKSAAANQITVATLTGYSATKNYYVEFDLWSAAVASQRTDAEFLGDSTDAKIENTGKPYYWV